MSPHSAPDGPTPLLQVGDWMIFDLAVSQIKELRHDDGYAVVADAFTQTSGKIATRLRSLTLKSLRCAQLFESQYRRLKEIDGAAGFNYPDISEYFSALCLDTIDSAAADPFDKA